MEHVKRNFQTQLLSKINVQSVDEKSISLHEMKISAICLHIYTNRFVIDRNNNTEGYIL